MPEHEHGCGCAPWADDDPDGTRFILYRLPDPALEEVQRYRHRMQRRSLAVLGGLMLAMVGLSIGYLVHQIRSGDSSNIADVALVTTYAAVAAFLAFTGCAGALGKFHDVNAHNCAIALEDDERELHHYGMGTEPLDGVAAENVPEYLRLLKIVENGTEYLQAVERRIRELKEHNTEPGPGDDPEPDVVVKGDHVE